MDLRYGMNPHQTPAVASAENGLEMPLRVLNGRPGYINLLDALKGWQIVRELSAQSGLPAAVSMKHTNPVGAALGKLLPFTGSTPWDDGLRDLPPLAIAYLRARAGDPVAAYGDFICLSHPVDSETAASIGSFVSDGIIAPGYSSEAVERLRCKKSGTYLILQINERYEPPAREDCTLFGIRLMQPCNNARVDTKILERCVTEHTTFSESAQCDLVMATIVVKYCQSNATCIAFNGQLLGVGVGQQSRIASTRIACDKADLWKLKRHPQISTLQFQPQLKGYQRENAVEQFLRWEQLQTLERQRLLGQFRGNPQPVSAAEAERWLAQFNELSMSGDGFIPFRDNIDRSARSGVRYIVQPGGSARDADVIAAANEYHICMAFSGLRLFYH